MLPGKYALELPTHSVAPGQVRHTFVLLAPKRLAWSTPQHPNPVQTALRTIKNTVLCPKRVRMRRKYSLDHQA